jgi:SAM-dependent methyltransferase
VTKDFYTELEAAFRGSRSLIKARLSVYTPLLQALCRMGVPVSVLDLGCGRGEWLEVLREQGISATGVDLDPQMLAMAQESGQAILQADALDYLEKQPDDSLVLVTAFHLVEHLPFDRVKELVAHALRVLVPGGILLMETPNPENMVVAAWKFYLDPSHQKPIPPMLLSFVSRYAGFFRTQTLGLNPPDPPPQDDAPSLRQVLEGMGSDYAVVAQKSGDPAMTACADSFFNTGFSCSQEAFVAAYDTDIHRDIYRDIQKNSEMIKALNSQIKALNSQVKEVNVRLRHEADTARSELEAVYASSSWRITRPVRALKKRLFRSRSSAFEPDPDRLPPTAGRIFKDLRQAVKNKNRDPE